MDVDDLLKTLQDKFDLKPIGTNAEQDLAAVLGDPQPATCN